MRSPFATMIYGTAASAAVPVGTEPGLPPRSGVGLKPQHFRAVLEEHPDLGFFEVHAENYMVEGGPLHHFLGKIRERYPLSLHGVGLSLGGEAPPDADHLMRLAALIERYQPAAFSEHLAWSAYGGVFFNDLLPLEYDDSALVRVCEHVEQVQERLKRQLLLENPATYLSFSSSFFTEAQFLREVVARTGCGLLLDVNNAYVSCANRAADPMVYIDALPLEAVGEIHLAGHSQDTDAAGARLLIDNHGSPVADAVWDLYRRVIARIGAMPTLIEWDNDVPPFPVLLGEARRAQAVMSRQQHPRPCDVGWACA